jgi:hypothetical protein
MAAEPVYSYSIIVKIVWARKNSGESVGFMGRSIDITFGGSLRITT